MSMRRSGWTHTLGIVGGVVVLASGCNSQAEQDAAPAAQGTPASAATLDPIAAKGLPPLPRGAWARAREQVEAAYLFAAQHPEVLEYVPCFCGCERVGHGSNHDCFVKSRSATDEIQWATHGMG